MAGEMQEFFDAYFLCVGHIIKWNRPIINESGAVENERDNARRGFHSIGEYLCSLPMERLASVCLELDKFRKSVPTTQQGYMIYDELIRRVFCTPHTNPNINIKREYEAFVYDCIHSPLIEDHAVLANPVLDGGRDNLIEHSQNKFKKSLLVASRLVGLICWAFRKAQLLRSAQDDEAVVQHLVDDLDSLNKEVVNRIIKYDVDKYFSLSLTHGLARPVEYTPDDEPLPVTPQWIADSFKLGPWEPMWSVGRYRGTKQAYGFTG